MTPEEKRCCEKGKEPQSCSPEQIRECHGEVAEHPCCGESEEKEEDKD